MRHRGPDADGLWAEDDAVVGHRRLKIIDLSARSDQPACSPSGRHVLVYNGEVYNFRDLSPDAPGDTLALAGDDGLAAHPARLRGMFAYARWDREDHELLLVRDRFGIKPLYYGIKDHSLAFASTASAVARVHGRHEIDRAAIASYLRFGSVRGPRTILDGVTELDPGSLLRWTGGVPAPRPYWSFDDAAAAPPAADLHAALRNSVAAHTISDVPVALFLSGGVDSAVVGALAVEAGLDVTAFTLAFPGSDVDEADDAVETARTLGLKHEVVEFRDVAPDFDGYFAATDQPSIDGMNTYLVSKAASDAGFRVALTGLGADELFCGYSSFRRVAALSVANRVLPKPVVTRALGMSRGNRAKAPGLAAAGGDFKGLNDELRSVFTAADVERLCGVPWVGSRVPVSAARPMDAMTRLELAGYLRNTLLRDSDAFSMAHSLELRTPFVDHEVLAAALAIGNGRRAWLRKRLLADAVGVPRVAELLRKPKRGFRLPFPQWLGGPLRDRVDDLPEGPVADVCDGREVRRERDEWLGGHTPYARVWSLVVLDAWLRRETATRR